ncbi:hypothetical protein FHS31_002581 [Sphingomonas vulcanisoli]|uniref:Ice-binding protein C-terminal domain-containing protein n=1 Tax=Sphingomonas vulcanisoli TaxID=1658060 RepID=A0ABX0TZ86_9SPHN|nr:PEPxxWA-CTERM sorting domain-containing protein [Sphingomonas vulcanisoli]NIJ08951.1 hypothetical protein [Sphingomonas vulcanisoli]
MLSTSLRALALIGGAFLLAEPSLAATQVSPLTTASLTSTGYTQNFDTLANTGTSNVLPVGWQISETGTSSAADGSYTANNGSANAGNAYSYGANGSTDRALGSLTSGTNSPVSFGFIFSNDTGGTITALNIGYTGEQWRLSNAASDSLTFQYSTDATDVSDAGGTWQTFSALNFASVKAGGTSTGAALDGNDAANQAAISGLLGDLSIASGQSFAIRWRDLDVTGGDNGLAVDDFSLTATSASAATVPEPASWAMMVGGFGLIGSAMRRRNRAIAAA